MFLVTAVLFILSLGGLAKHETARRGNLYGIVGMAVAIIATMMHPSAQAWAAMIAAVALGGCIGAVLAVRVAMTAMPQLVAMLHSFVGLAAVLVGMASYLSPGHEIHGAELGIHLVEIWGGVAIGSITFTGSVVAWAKLRGSLSGAPLLLPGRHVFNGAIVLGMIAMMIPFLIDGFSGVSPALLGAGGILLLVMTVLSGVLGAHLVASIGGADMPVVVSMLNSYSGWAATAAGFMLSNDLLIVTGALVGSSGAILSYIMCKAMNRSIWNVMFGGFGTASGSAASTGEEAPVGEVITIDIEGTAQLAREAKSVMIVPGYGMAVARAQHLVHEFSTIMRKKGVEVRYAIHPVAGRLPGHMNVLLAEANVPYDIVMEMDEINGDCPSTDLVLVIGANDIVNPGAETDASSPIYGMPVVQVWKAGHVIVLKRGMAAGYAGVGNPLFFEENTRMLFGDARDSMQKLVETLR